MTFCNISNYYLMKLAFIMNLISDWNFWSQAWHTIFIKYYDDNIRCIALLIVLRQSLLFPTNDSSAADNVVKRINFTKWMILAFVVYETKGSEVKEGVLLDALFSTSALSTSWLVRRIIKWCRCSTKPLNRRDWIAGLSLKAKCNSYGFP